MQRVSIDILRNDLSGILNSVLDNQEPVAVILEKDKEVMLIDVEDYNSIMETLHLLRSPANVKRLQKGIKQHREGKRKAIDVTHYIK